MKKLLALMLALALVLSMAACGSSAASSASAASAAASEEAAASEASAPAEEAEAAPAEEAEAAPAEEAASAELADSEIVGTASMTNINAEEGSAEEEAAPAEEEAAPAEVNREVTLPLTEDDETLSMWIRLNFMDTDPIQSNADSPILQEAEELTGVKIEYTEVSSASESETFNLMIAGGDYTDLIYNFVKLYTGGVDSAIDNDIIIDLNDVMDSAPIYESILASDDDVRRAATTDEGAVGAFYSIYESSPYVTTGLTMRGDWLEELGLDAPVTYDDFENVLLAFKDAYNPKYPVYMSACGAISGLTAGYEFAYSIAGDTVTLFCQRDGQVVFSATDDNFREYLKVMHRWYDEGLISTDFATDGDWMFMNSEYQAMMANGDTGLLTLGGGLYSEFESVGIDVDDNYSLVGVVNPRLDADTPAGTFPNSRVSDGIFSITTACENTDLACSWCDFWYSETGSLLATYGIEGESYTLGDDGKPVYTDYILNNADYSDRSMKNLYSFNTCCYMDPDKDLSGVSDSGNAAIQVWANDEPNPDYSTITMTSLSMTDDESTEYGIICADAQTYCQENVLKFINGDLSIDDDWDAYVAVLEDMGVSTATEIVQAAYDRYLAR